MLWFPSPDVAPTWTGTTLSDACHRRSAERKPPCGWSPAVLPQPACHRRLLDQGILLGGVVFSLAQHMIPWARLGQSFRKFVELPSFPLKYYAELSLITFRCPYACTALASSNIPCCISLSLMSYTLSSTFHRRRSLNSPKLYMLDVVYPFVDMGPTILTEHSQIQTSLTLFYSLLFSTSFLFDPFSIININSSLLRYILSPRSLCTIKLLASFHNPTIAYSYLYD